MLNSSQGRMRGRYGIMMGGYCMVLQIILLRFQWLIRKRKILDHLMCVSSYSIPNVTIESDCKCIIDLCTSDLEPTWELRVLFLIFGSLPHIVVILFLGFVKMLTRLLIGWQKKMSPILYPWILLITNHALVAILYTNLSNLIIKYISPIFLVLTKSSRKSTKQINNNICLIHANLTITKCPLWASRLNKFHLLMRYMRI